MRYPIPHHLPALCTTALFALAAVFTTGCGENSTSSGNNQGAKQSAQLTYTRDIAPIVYKNCSYCHRPDQSTPFNLLTYDDVRKRARQISEVVTARYMPPWLPAPGFNHFANERVLTESEIATINAWVEAGTPEGKPGDLPPPPKFEGGWHLGQPDLIVKMPEPFELPSDGPDVYRNFVMPIPIDKPRYVRALEFRPDNGRVVHHAFFAVDASEESLRLDLNDPGPGFGGAHIPRSGEVPDGQFFSWQPGKLPMGGDARRSWLLQTNSWMVVQQHMQTTGKRETIQSEVGIYYSDSPGTDITYKIGLSSYDLDMPAGVTNFVAEDVFELPVDVELLAVLPHAHFIARKVHGMASLPDGSNRWLLNIDKWDFNWQGEYWYSEPIQLPKGSRVGMRFFFDNSTNNPVNPNTPPIPVSYGKNSTDEMAELWMIFRLKSQEDRAILNRAALPKLATDIITYNRRLLAKEPDLIDPWVRIGTAYYALNQPQPCADALQRALARNPRLDEAHYYLGLVAFDAGGYEQARQSLATAVEINPKNYKAHGYLGLTYMHLGDLHLAENCLLDALKLHPDDEVTIKNLNLVRDLRQNQSPAPLQP